jgi:hypothetical protein
MREGRKEGRKEARKEARNMKEGKDVRAALGFPYPA